MGKIKEIWAMVTQKKYLPLWFFAAIQLVYHILIREPESSDAMWFFRNQLEAYSLKDYLTIRYHTWTSRMVVEAALVYVSRHMLLWKLLDYVMWMLLAFSLSYFIPKDKKAYGNWFVVALLLIYPIQDLSTAGWIATTMNYTWPLALGTFALTGVAKVYRREHIRVWLVVLYSIATIYAANVEQMCAVLLGVYGLTMLYVCIDRKSLKGLLPIFIGFFISAAEIVFILTCPGNGVRKMQEIVNWMPDYLTLNLLDKIQLSFVDTMHYMLSGQNLLFLLFAIALATLVFLKTGKIFYHIVALVPVIWNIVLVFFSDMFEHTFEEMANIFEANEIINGTNYQMAENYVPLMVYILVILCVLISLVMVCSTWFELLAHAGILGIGFATRLVMGFTPTLYVSQERTYLFFYMSIIVSTIFLILQNLPLLEKHVSVIRYLKITGACVMVFAICNGIAVAGMY